MPKPPVRPPAIVPYGADETVYLVVDRFDRQGSETEVERTDIETIIEDLFAAQFSDPVRVVAFNTLEHWTKNISEDVAAEILTRCDIEGADVPEHIRDFVASFTGPARSTASRPASSQSRFRQIQRPSHPQGWA